MGYKSQETRALISGQVSFLQCALMSGGVNVSHLWLPGAPKSGIAAFEKEYAHWVEEQDKKTNALKTALHSPLPDNEIDDLVKDTLNHYANLFTIKATAAKADVCYLISGVWKTSTERQFMWIGGFRPLDLLKVLVSQLDLSDQQSHDLYNLKQACQQAEDSLSQGMETLLQRLAEAVAFGQALEGGSYEMNNAMGKLEDLLRLVLQVLVSQLDLSDQQSHDLYNLKQACQQAEDSLSQGMETLLPRLAEAVAFGQALEGGSYEMNNAMGKLEDLLRLVLQADFIRHETLQQTLRYLPTRQVAQGLISLGEYFQRLRHLGSAWSRL